MHYQLDLVCATRKRDSEVSRATVLDSILESFLQNTKQTERDFVGHLSRNTLGMKIDLNPLEFGTLFAETPGRCYESQIFELGGMQAVRQGLDIVPEIGSQLTGLFHATARCP